MKPPKLIDQLIKYPRRLPAGDDSPSLMSSIFLSCCTELNVNPPQQQEPDTSKQLEEPVGTAAPGQGRREMGCQVGGGGVYFEGSWSSASM